MCRTYAEDTIDFRCSDSWRDYYFERGLTPYHSPSYRGCRDRLADSVEEIKTAVRDMTQLVLDNLGGQSKGPVQPVQSPTRPILPSRYIDLQ